MESNKLQNSFLGNHGPCHNDTSYLESSEKKIQSELWERNTNTWLGEIYAPVTLPTIVPRTLEPSIFSMNESMTAVVELYKASTQLEDSCPGVRDLNDATLSKQNGNPSNEAQNSHPGKPGESDSASTSTCVHKYTSVLPERTLSVNQIFDAAKTIISVANDISDQRQASKGISSVDILGSGPLEIGLGKMVKEDISLAIEKKNDIRDGGLIQAAGKMLLTSAPHMLKEVVESETSGAQALGKADNQNAVFENFSVNKIGEAALDQIGLGKTLGTVNEIISVTEAVKHGDVTAILEDEHVKELGKKALGFGLEMATSAILTASGAGMVMAVASATSEVIAAAKEVKETETVDKHHMASFIIEAGAKIALKAAIKGSGAEAALSIAAPILEPLSKKVIEEIAEHGADFIDHAATSPGMKEALLDEIGAVTRFEDSILPHNVPIVGEKLVDATFKTGEAQLAGAISCITGNGGGVNFKPKPQASLSADNATQEMTEGAQSVIAIMNKASLATASICLEFDKSDKTIDVPASNSLGGTTTTTIVSEAMDAINTRSTGRFEPIWGGMELLKVLRGMSDCGELRTINGLSATAIAKTYELTGNGISIDTNKHITLFDPDGDGIVHYSDTVRALALLGLTGFVVRLAAYNFHMMFSYPTSDKLLPRFNLSLPIQVKNMEGTAQGRKWGTLNRAKFLEEHYIQQLFSDSNNNIWLMGSQGLQILLFLFEWGTMWPLQLPVGSESVEKLAEEISTVFTHAVIPFTLNHWKLFQKTKSETNLGMAPVI